MSTPSVASEGPSASRPRLPAGSLAIPLLSVLTSAYVRLAWAS